jgi:hypothetical protein
LLVDGATSGKFDVIPVKVKSGRSGYEFDVSKKQKLHMTWLQTSYPKVLAGIRP